MAKILKGLLSPIKDFDGVELKDSEDRIVTIKIIIANSIAGTKSDDAVRAMKIALNIHNAGDEIELEDADFNLVKKAVKDNQNLVNANRAPVLEILDKVE